MHPCFLPLPKVADRYSVTRNTIYRWLNGDTVQDFPRPIKLGKAVVFDIQELEAWEAAQRAKRAA